LQHFAGALGDVLGRGGRGIECRRILLGALERGLVGASAGQRHGRNAGEALKLDAGAGIGTHLHRLVDAEHRDDLLRIVGAQLDTLDFAHPNAVEQDRAAGAQAGHRTLKQHAVISPLGPAADMLKPVDEAEHGDDHRQREQSDQRIIGLGFHRASLI
jgi:hypothetical protein